MKRITHWTIAITWEDGKQEFIDDIPNYVASAVDEFLNELEEEENEE
jgi:hypothetical protein